MDCITDHEVDEVWVIKSAQIGWSEILLNTFGYYVDVDPSPVMMVQPTVDLGEAFSKERIAPMIRDTPRINRKIADSKSRDSGNTLTNKTFHGGHLAIVGANAPAGLRSRPIRVLLLDEVDAYPESAGTEGDPVNLAKNRQKTFWNKKTLAGSTPTVKGQSRVEQGYESSDQRHFEFGCPHCGEYQRLVWSQVKWSEFELEPIDAVYQCVHCGEVITDAERVEMLGDFKVVAAKNFDGIAGFHVNELMSPFVTLGEMAVEFIQAKKLPSTFQTWINSALGETWVDQAAEVKAEGLTARREPYGPELIPAEVVLLSLGVDTQDDRLEGQLLGWGEGEECWIIEHKVLRGDPGGKVVWRDLDEYRHMAYTCEDGRVIRVQACAVDSGGHYSQQVFDYAHARQKQHVYAIRGLGGVGKLAWPKKPGKSKATKADVYSIGVDTIKEVLYGRLARIIEPGDGYIHLPMAWDEELSDQLTSERKIFRNVHGRRVGVWRPKLTGVRQEAQDCWVYGYAAMLARGVNLSQLAAAVAERDARLQSQQVAEEAKIAATPQERRDAQAKKPQPTRKKKLRRSSSNYLKR